MITQDEIDNSEIKALSWKQPYGTLMLYGKQETRTRQTKYRGLVLICTSLIPYNLEEVLKISGQCQFDRITQEYLTETWQGLTGLAIGVGRLVDCQNMQECAFSIEEIEEKTYVSYRNDLWIHFYEDVRHIYPFKWKGSQGWSNLTADQRQQIKLMSK